MLNLKSGFLSKTTALDCLLALNLGPTFFFLFPLCLSPAIHFTGTQSEVNIVCLFVTKETTQQESES